MTRQSTALTLAGALWLAACGRDTPPPPPDQAKGEQAPPPPLVDVATDATDPNSFSDTEPSIAVNPTNPLDIAVVTFAEPWGPGEKAPVWRSSDGGKTWRKERMLPQIDPGFGGPADQALTFSATGRLFLVTLGDDGSQLRNKIMRPGSSPGELLLGAGFGDDQPQLGGHRTTGTCAARIYSAWLDTRNGGTSMVTASADEGANVESAAAGHTLPNRTTRLAVGQNEAYVVFKSRIPNSVANGFEKARFMVRRSDDCGKKWNGLGADGVSVTGTAEATTFFTNTFGNPAKGKVARARSSDAWIATAPDGAVYAVYVNKDNSGFGQLFVARSSDRGRTWTSTRVTDGRNHSAYPEIAVAANGAVGVLYIDYDDSGAKTVFRHRFARSFDSGATWTNEILQPLDPSVLDNADDGFLWGDYEGLTAEGNTFFGVFSGESIGRAKKEMDPIFFTRAAVR
jgi:hypothetical protein